MPKPVLIIINPVAGPRKSKGDILAQLQKKQLTRDADIYETKSRGDATEAAKQAANNGYKTVVAVGGDGTVNEVATAIVNTDVALAVIPRGSGNGLARALNIPFDASAAIDLAFKNKIKKIDIGQAAHRYFCAVSGIGFDAKVSEKFDKSKVRGFFSYAWIITRELKGYTPPVCEIDINGDSIKCTPFLVSVANSPQYGNGALIAPKARLDDGYFDVCVANNMAFYQLLAAVPRLFLGTLDKHSQVSYFKVEKITFRSHNPIQFHIDGEPERTGPELTIRVLPGALNVCVP